MKPRLSKLCIILASLVIALVMCEAGLRLLGISYPDFYDYDPFLGSKLRPGVSGCFLKEGGGYVSINSDGLRDREHALAHPPNTMRIAVIGDSFSEAMQVNQEETFWAIMEKDLQGCPNLGGRRVEVINFGQAGFSMAQELLALRHRAWKYSPDVVLLALFTDDIRRNLPEFMQYDFNPYFVLEGGRLVLHDRRTRQKWEEEQQKKSLGGELKRWRQDHFRIFQVWRQFQTVFKAWWSKPRQNGEAHASQAGSEAGLSDNMYCEPRSKVWQEAWKVNEALLVQMRDEVAARGARFYVVVLTTGAQVLPDPENRAAFAKKLGVPDLLYADHRLEKYCRQEGIPVLLLTPTFQDYATAHRVFLHGFNDNLGGGHWNQAGHRLAGDTVARWLCNQLP